MRAVLASVVGLLGCSSEAPSLSTDVSTRDMILSAYADGDQAGTHVRVSLDGPGPHVHLVGTDRLVLLAGGAEVPMGRDGQGQYVADLAPSTVGLSIRLARAAPETSVEVAIPMPPATAITTLATASRAAPLQVTWTPASGPQTTTLDLAGTCIPPITRPLSFDTGSYTLLPADLGGPSTDTCEVTVTLTRAFVEQSNAPPLQYTNVSVHQVATTVFVSTP